MIMKMNSSSGRISHGSVQPVPPKSNAFRPFKGLLSKGGNNNKSSASHNSNPPQDPLEQSTRSSRGIQQQQQQQSNGPSDDLDITHSPRRRRVNEFLPNPEIPASPSGDTPPRKTWEGAYNNFLSSKRKTGSPSQQDNSSKTKSKGPASNETRKSNFLVMPGTKRLLVRARPAHARADTHADADGIPALPTMPQRPTSKSTRAQSMSDLGMKQQQQHQRGGNILKTVFGRSTSDGSVSLQQRRRKKSVDSDELDGAMRNGMHKEYSPDTHGYLQNQHPRHYQQPSEIIEETSHVRSISQEHIPDGLDSLLASASSSPHFSVELAGLPRSTSSYAKMFPLTSTPESEQPSYSGSAFPHPASSGSLNHHQMGLSLDDEGSSPHSNSMSHGFPFASKPIKELTGGGIGSLLAEHNDQNQPSVPPSFRPVVAREGIGAALASDARADLDACLQDSALSVNSSLSGSQQAVQSLGTPPTVDPEMKKAFTNFHNQAQYARDSTSAFLGEDGLNSSPHYTYGAYQMATMGARGGSAPRQAYSSVDLAGAAMGRPLPITTLDENNLSIHDDMRLLKPVQGTESWETGRRYLIAPAALSACPLQTVNRLSKGYSMLSPKDAASNEKADLFQPISFGACLMTYVGEKHHLSLGKWSSCQLVLRQNYLMEFEGKASLAGLPRGSIHLQHATAYAHSIFPDSLELDFYASPCARSDRRVLMIRVTNREARDHCIACLNRAAGLRIDDLWEFDENVEYGRGRYAAVFPARRKQFSSDTPNSTEELKEKSDYDDEYECALKIVDKNEFWRRVVKGRERADTLVREVAVQATLTTKRGDIPTFLQLRGYFETSDNVVMELELLEGTDLFRYISAKGVLEETEAARILRDMLKSLDAMHRVGLVHRDIKPANVLMCDVEKDKTSVKVGDFGMSTFVGVDGLVRGRCGTPGYVAPEILTADSGQGCGDKVDLFSVGVTLYVMLCGYEPFYGENEKDLIEANKKAAIEFNDSDWKSTSDLARDMIRKLTAPDPKERISAKDALQHPWIKSMVDIQ